MNYLAKEALSACSVWNAIVGRHTWIPASGTGHHGAPVRHSCVLLIIYRGTFPVIIPVGLAANALSPIHSFALPFAREKAPLAAVFGVFCQEMRKYDIKMHFFPRKVWWEPKFVIPLHPLSGTNVPGAYEKRSLRRFT